MRDFSKKEAVKFLKLLKETIDNGYKLNQPPSAVVELARRLHLATTTVRWRVERCRHYGFSIPEPRAEPILPAREAHDPRELQLQRVKEEGRVLRADIANLQRELNDAQNIRQKILGLTAAPLAPFEMPPVPQSKKKGEAAVLHLSDIHWGEVIDEDAMGGLNKYDTDIAGWRLLRCFQAAADLCTKHWSGPPITRFYLILGGDMFSGDIHFELEKTNEDPMPRPVKQLLAHLVTAIHSLLSSVPCEVVVISVPGNHSRTSKKPEAKRIVASNYDSLLSDLLEWHFKTILKEKRISFFRPESGDALFRIFSWQWLAVHGDRIGSKGGQGFIGPAATIARGMKKLVDAYAASRVFIDQMLVGHFHTALELEHGHSNGCLCGPNEYSTIELRARPKPATQNFFQVHPERGITLVRKIQVGHPSEGTLYKGVSK